MRFRKLVSSEWFQARWPTVLTKWNETHVENDIGGWRDALPQAGVIGMVSGALANRAHKVERDPRRERHRWLERCASASWCHRNGFRRAGQPCSQSGTRPTSRTT